MRALVVIAFMLAGIGALNATCLNPYGCEGRGRIDLRDPRAGANLRGERYEPPYVQEENRRAREREDDRERSRALERLDSDPERGRRRR